jgi:Rps23 Pro-64 3,4-dihydroxylase Tpa1-like proline 4-hydroxylase
MKQLSDYIVVLENTIPNDLIAAIHREYISSDDWILATTGGGLNPKIRNCSTIGISFSNTIQKNPVLRTHIDAEIHTATRKILAKCCGKFTNLRVTSDTGYDLLRYETGQFYTQHTDSFEEQPRMLSCSIVLNDDYEGGEFAFFDRELTYKIPKGSAILFPSNFMYPHEIMPVTSGTRYSIITWFR